MVVVLQLCAIKTEVKDRIALRNILLEKVQSISKDQTNNNCEIRLNSIIKSTIFTNGSINEEWFIDKCGKKERYSISYYPPDLFPERDSPADIMFIEDNNPRNAKEKASKEKHSKKTNIASLDSTVAIALIGGDGEHIYSILEKEGIACFFEGSFVYAVLVFPKDREKAIEILKKDSMEKCYWVDFNIDSDEDDCKIHGGLVLWQALYCMYENSIFEFQNESVQKCYYARIAIDDNSNATECEKKEFYKHRFCEAVSRITNETTLKDCLSDEEIYPSELGDLIPPFE